MWNRNRIQIARCLLWSVLLVGSLVLQATVCNRLPLFGAIPLLLPSAVVCIGAMGSAEFGAVFGLVGGLIGYLGGDASALVIPMLSLAGALAGGLCTSYFTRSFFPALLLSATALFMCEVPTWALNVYLGHIPMDAFLTVLLPEVAYSLFYVPLLYLLSWQISLLGKR